MGQKLLGSLGAEPRSRGGSLGRGWHFLGVQPIFNHQICCGYFMLNHIDDGPDRI